MREAAKRGAEPLTARKLRHFGRLDVRPRWRARLTGPPPFPIAGVQMDLSSDPHQTADTGTADLHVCPDCGSDLVHPVEWAPVDMCSWRVELRCPECERRTVGVHRQPELDRFDEVLDAGTDAMVANLRRIQRSNMEQELQRFNLALGNDLILPEDF